MNFASKIPFHYPIVKQVDPCPVLEVFSVKEAPAQAQAILWSVDVTKSLSGCKRITEEGIY